MRGTVLLAEDCVGDGSTLPSPINTLPVRNNKIYWYARVFYTLKSTFAGTRLFTLFFSPFHHSVRFRDPKYSNNFIFPARKLKGAKEPPRVLKPQDFEQMNRNTGNTWKPQIGFTPSTQTASLSDAGRRMLG